MAQPEADVTDAAREASDALMVVEKLRETAQTEDE